MNFSEALKILNIEDYGERIFKSSSTGELSHLWDYMTIAETLNSEGRAFFREWFISAVEQAEKKWSRPESIYQHVLKVFNESIKRDEEKKK